MLTTVTGLVRQGKFLLNENSRTILTGVGIVGTVTTTYLTGRATFKAAAIIERETTKLEKEAALEDDNGESPKIVELTRFQKVKLVWHHYIPPGVTLVTTITCMIVANKIASRKIAALAIASGVSERALQEYKAKVIEKLGERQDEKIRDEVAQDRVTNNPVRSQEVIITGTGDHLCYDHYTGRYFQSSAEKIRQAENKINYELNNLYYASASEFYDALGLPATTLTDTMGWNANKRVEVQLSTVMSTDDRPCLAIDFVQPPFVEYAQLHD